MGRQGKGLGGAAVCTGSRLGSGLREAVFWPDMPLTGAQDDALVLLALRSLTGVAAARPLPLRRQLQAAVGWTRQLRPAAQKGLALRPGPVEQGSQARPHSQGPARSARGCVHGAHFLQLIRCTSLQLLRNANFFVVCAQPCPAPDAIPCLGPYESSIRIASPTSSQTSYQQHAARKRRQGGALSYAMSPRRSQHPGPRNSGCLGSRTAQGPATPRACQLPGAAAGCRRRAGRRQRQRHSGVAHHPARCDADRPQGAASFPG